MKTYLDYLSQCHLKEQVWEINSHKQINYKDWLFHTAGFYEATKQEEESSRNGYEVISRIYY